MARKLAKQAFALKHPGKWMLLGDRRLQQRRISSVDGTSVGAPSRMTPAVCLTGDVEV
jgi:hypothetical protein